MRMTLTQTGQAGFAPARRAGSHRLQQEGCPTPAQCREARARLGWDERQLAEAVGCSHQTIRYFEAGNGRPRNRTIAAIGAALEKAGIVPAL